MRAVEVVWEDAWDIQDWFSRVDLDATLLEKDMTCRTRGWLYSEDEKRLVVVMTTNPTARPDEESMAGVLVIPRGMIKEIIYQDELPN